MLKTEVEIAKKLLIGDTIIDNIRNDKETYYGFQANIAMQFIDEYNRNIKRYKNRSDIHEIANEAAKNFLNLLIK